MCGSWKGTKDDLVFNFCQNQQCCSTGPIGLPSGNLDCKKTDIYNLSELGDCAKMDFLRQNIQGNLTFSENIGGIHDGWRGDWFRLIYSGMHISSPKADFRFKNGHFYVTLLIIKLSPIHAPSDVQTPLL